MELNYYRTLIAVADDCPVPRGTVPSARGKKPTIATIQYEMIVDDPHVHTQEDVLFESWLRRQPAERARGKAEVARLRAELFAKPQPCLRCSPLPKQLGWGLLFDERGRVALCPVESATYRRIVGGEVAGVQVVKAMRSRRA
jgi:hypothetical protein